MKTDEIITEVHAVRDAHAAQFNFDVQAIFNDLQASEAKRIAQGHPYVSEPFAVPLPSAALQRTRFVHFEQR
jgi:hypothetical protein